MSTTAQNFVQVGSRDPADFMALDKALAYLSTSPTAFAELADMVERGIAVSINHDGREGFQDGVVYWDPNIGLQTVDSEGNLGGVISAALAFAHEGAHSIDTNVYNLATFRNDKWQTDGERQAGQVEAQVATELNEPARENHMGALLHVGDVTEHTRENGNGTYNWVLRDSNGNEVTGPGYSPTNGAQAPSMGGGAQLAGPGGDNGTGEGAGGDDGDGSGGGGGGGGGGGVGGGGGGGDYQDDDSVSPIGSRAALSTTTKGNHSDAQGSGDTHSAEPGRAHVATVNTAPAHAVVVGAADANAISAAHGGQQGDPFSQTAPAPEHVSGHVHAQLIGQSPHMIEHVMLM